MANETHRAVRFMSVENPETRLVLMVLLKSQTPGDGMLQICKSDTGDSERAPWFVT